MIRTTLLAALLATAFSAHAGTISPLTSTQVLNQLNVVALDTISSQSHVDGRAWAGGSVTGGEYGGHLSSAPASNYAGLSAGGSVSGVHVNGGGAVVAGSLSNAIVNSGSAVVKGGAANTNFNGPAYVAGGASGTNFNGGRAATETAAMQTADSAASSTNFGKVLNTLSDSLAKLGSTGSDVKMEGNKATFTAVANSSGVAVFDLTKIDEQLFKLGEFQFNLNGASTVIFNTDVTTASIGANFLGGGAQAIGAKAIWNFYEATNLSITSQFGGAVLATDALLTNTQNIEGGVFVHDLKQYGEIHLAAFTGNVDFVKNVSPVPEPGSLALMVGGLAVLGALRLRRKA